MRGGSRVITSAHEADLFALALQAAPAAKVANGAKKVVAAVTAKAEESSDDSSEIGRAHV